VFLVFKVNPPFYLDVPIFRLEHSLTLCDEATDVVGFVGILATLGTFFNKFFLLPYFLNPKFYLLSACFVVFAS
jgi:hypothetical protein